MERIRHLYSRIDDVDLFYREAGPADAPTLFLLHGFPSSSLQYRYLIAALCDRWHVVAPDMPGFGFTKVNGPYLYTFDALAATIGDFIQREGRPVAAVYLHDYGAQVGYRLLLNGAIRPGALIIQNSEVYHGAGWHDAMWGIEKRRVDPPAESRARLMKHLFNPEGIRKEFMEDLPPDITSLIDPAVIALAVHKLDDPAYVKSMMDLHMDYGANIQNYPKVQQYFRDHPTPALILWGNRDQYLSTEAGQAYTRDLPDAEFVFMDGGHWLLESHSQEVNAVVRGFLERHI